MHKIVEMKLTFETEYAKEEINKIIEILNQSIPAETRKEHLFIAFCYCMIQLGLQSGQDRDQALTYIFHCWNTLKEKTK